MSQLDLLIKQAFNITNRFFQKVSIVSDLPAAELIVKLGVQSFSLLMRNILFLPQSHIRLVLIIIVSNPAIYLVDTIIQ